MSKDILMDKERERAEKIVYRIHELAACSADSDMINRIYGKEAFMGATDKLKEWMKDAGLETRIDAIGNVRARWPSDLPDARTFVIGSHFDTVVNAGPWDGPLGILMGLDLLEEIIRKGKKLPFHIELIAFCDEEGVRYHTTYLGSKVVAGTFDKAVLAKEDADGIPLAAAIAGIGGDPALLDGEAIPAGGWLGYFEIHIEQGPVLYQRNIPVAIVEGIAGQIRARATFHGTAGHAGTVPMQLRTDALCGAAEFILEGEKIALAAEGRLVATVGQLQILHAASNVIPGEVCCSVDIRSAETESLARYHEKIRMAADSIAARRQLRLDWEVFQTSPPVHCDPQLSQLLQQAAQDAGHNALTLMSGAGHDAVPISAVAPVCMLFVRCFKGISHNPLEHVETTDLAAAIGVADNFMTLLAAFNVKG